MATSQALSQKFDIPHDHFLKILIFDFIEGGGVKIANKNPGTLILLEFKIFLHIASLHLFT